MILIVANSPSPMRVAFLRHREPAGYRIRIAMRAGDIDPRETLPRAGILSIAINLPANQSAPVSTPLRRVIAALSSLGSEVLARAIERTRTPIALARANISTRVGLRRLICNLRWHPTAASKLSTSPLVQDANQSTRGFSYRFQFSPVLSLPAAHESNVSKDSCHERQVTCKG